MKNNMGLTLIECMLALILSMMILSGLISIFLAAESGFRYQAELSQIQENARIAIELVRTDLNMAGYMGCAKLTDDFPLTNLPPYELTPLNKITVTENSVQVRHAGIKHDNLTQTMQDHSILYATSEYKFSDHDILMISDCKSAEIFSVQHVAMTNNLQKITTTQPLAVCYEKNAEISQLEMNTYFVDQTERRNSAGLPIYALYRSDIHHRKTEIVEGVELMQASVEPDQTGIALGWIFSAENLKKKWLSYVALRD